MGKMWWVIVAVGALGLAFVGYFYKDLRVKHTICSVDATSRLSCPATSAKGFISLSNAHLATGLVLGFNPGYGFVETIQEITKALKDHGENLKINILFSTSDEQEETETELNILRKGDDRNYYNFIPVKDREAVWVQDFVEVTFDPKQKHSVLIDLPYRLDEGDNVPDQLAPMCSLQTIKAPLLNDDQSSLASVSSAYGGNIEPLNKEWYMWGRDIPNPTANFFKTQAQPKSLDIDLSWLQAGHIDEILTTVPMRNKKSGECDIAIVYASPELALDLLTKSPAEKASETIDSSNLRYAHFSKCQNELTSTKKKPSEACRELVKANKRYEEIIFAAAHQASNVLAKSDVCTPVLLKVPVLYYPDMLLAEYGSKNDNATAAEPNAVNGISLNSIYVAPKQKRPLFEAAIKDALQTAGVDAIFVNGDALHKLGGGLHCWSQVLRTCG